MDAAQEVTTQKVRLRLLNASTARTYNSGFDDDRTFAAIATDGGLLRGPVSLQRIRFSPGERVDIVVTVKPSETVILKSYPPGLGAVVAPFAFGGNNTFDILNLHTATTLGCAAMRCLFEWG